jgi:hypothetical protein
MPDIGDRLRKNVLVREAPLVALLLMLGVCVTALGFIRHEWTGLLSAAPLVAVIALYRVRARQGRGHV